MAKLDAQTDPKLLAYARDTFLEPDSVLMEALARQESQNLPAIQVGELDGLHLEVLTRGFGVSKAIEIGTLGGYSALCIGRGLKEGGRLWTLEADPRHIEVAKENVAKAKMENCIEFLEGPALASLKALESKGPFDMVFVDADKVNYPNYLEWAAEHLRIGGVLIGDNTFAFGHIADEAFTDENLRMQVMALREFNRRMAKSGRFRSTLFPTGEGLTVGVKVR